MSKFILVLAAVMVAFIGLAFAASTASADGTVPWTGQGTVNGVPNTVDCTGDTAAPGSILWVLSSVNGATSATITISGQTFAMIQGGCNFKYVSGWLDLAALAVPALPPNVSATFLGNVQGNPQLVVSHGCPPLAIRVSKTATASSISDCTWTITKTNDKVGIVTLPDGGGPLPVGYTVVVTPTCVEKNFRVVGNITVTNISLVNQSVASVSDVLSDGAVGVVTCPPLPAVLRPLARWSAPTWPRPSARPAT